MDILISNNSTVPLYEQIAEQIKRQIVTGELEKGSMLPSIRALATSIKVSVITTKRAYDELENKGFITTVPGKGTFVSESNTELLRESIVLQIEEKLGDIIVTAKSVNLDIDDFFSMVKELYNAFD